MAHDNYNSEIKRLQNQLEKKLNWGPVKDWHSSMFEELSQTIFESSQVMLSPTTLKRFFGVVRYEGTPSTSTLDALSIYLGFKNWRAFRLTKTSRFHNLLNHYSNRSLYISIGFILAMTTIMLIANRNQENQLFTEDLSFNSNVLTRSYPNSVVFNLDLAGVQSDSIYIQQYWDPEKTITIDQDQTQATGIYYFPGYFRAKLLIDGKKVREHELFLKSHGWLGSLEYEPVPKYFEPERIGSSGLSYPSDLIAEVNNSKDALYSVYHYIDDLGKISGDNFQLEANLRNTYSERWAICQASKIYVLGTEGAMIIPTNILGCSSDNNLMLNDTYRNGKSHDLSDLSADLKESTPIKIVVQDKQATFFINGRQVYSDSYEKSMGSIVGLRFKFLGLGVVDSFSLKNSDGMDIILD